MKLRKSKCIYVMHNSALGINKIGYADDVNNRLSAIQCSAGMKIDFIYSSLPMYNYIEIENKLHEYFKNDRGIGEWFRTDKNIIIKHIQSISHIFEIDTIFKQWLENANISLLAKSFEVSRAAITKHLSKYNHIENNGYFIEDIKKALSTEDLIYKEVEEVLKDIPSQCKTVSKNIYEKEGSYYVKKFARSKWFIKRFDSVNECEKYILSITK